MMSIDRASDVTARTGPVTLTFGSLSVTRSPSTIGSSCSQLIETSLADAVAFEGRRTIKTQAIATTRCITPIQFASSVAAVYDRRIFVDSRKTGGHRPPLQKTCLYLTAIIAISTRLSADIS